jgi:hypothetical protein
MTIQHVLLLALSLLMLNACDKAPVTWQESVQKAIEENRTLAKEDFKLLPMEEYTDSEQFDGPRIMFEGPVPWPVEKRSTRSDTLWSIKPDGTDLRMILTLEEMYGDTRGCCINYNSDLARSRDNRYIAFVTGYKKIPETPDTSGMWMVDMKTREFIEVHREPAGDLNFTYQGDKLTYISYGYLYEYDISTGKTIKRDQPIQGSSGFTLEAPQNNIIMHRGTTIHFFTYEGQPIRTIDLKTLLPDWTEDEFRYSTSGSLYSANGRYMVIPFLDHGNTLIDLSEQPAIRLINQTPALPNCCVLLSSNGTYYQKIHKSIIEVYPEGESKKMPFPGNFIPRELTNDSPVLGMGNSILINEKY